MGVLAAGVDEHRRQRPRAGPAGLRRAGTRPRRSPASKPTPSTNSSTTSPPPHPDQWQPWMHAHRREQPRHRRRSRPGVHPETRRRRSRFVTARGGRVLLVGDDQQRAANGAGGILRDIEAAHGALTLTEVMRFTDPLEGQASLALRAGDTSVVGYLRRPGPAHRRHPRHRRRPRLHRLGRRQRRRDRLDHDRPHPADGHRPQRPRPRRPPHRRRRRHGGRRARPGREWVLPNGETVSAGDVVITKTQRPAARPWAAPTSSGTTTAGPSTRSTPTGRSPPPNSPAGSPGSCPPGTSQPGTSGSGTPTPTPPCRA